MKRLARLFLAPTPIGFCLRFGLLIGAFIGISLTSAFETLVEQPLILVCAQLSNALLNMLGAGTVRNGAFVSSPDFSFHVVEGCTGQFVFFLLLAAVLAFPTRWSSRLLCLLIGGTLIFVLNQIRIVSLYYVGVHWPHLFEDLHVYVWQGLIIVILTFFWYAWAARCPDVNAIAET